MKRLMALVLAATFAFGGVASAQSGVDVKVKGVWDFTFGWVENSFVNSRRAADRDLNRNDDNFVARQRVRTQINFIASENLQGVLFFEIGNLDWGRDAGNRKTGQGAGADLAADGVNIETRRAYLDWMVPDTGVSVRMGIQGLGLPSATDFVNPVFDDDVAAITVSYKFDDTFALTAFWARPFNQYLNDSTAGGNRSLDDEMDMFGLILPITLDGIEITPWYVYSSVGSESGFYQAVFDLGGALPTNAENTHATTWWAGIGVSVDMFDPLTFSFDVMYGDMHKMEVRELSSRLGHGAPGTTSEWGSRGWFVDARIDYAFDFGSLGLFGWWSTGDSAEGVNAGRFGRMPSGFADSGFAPTSFGWDRGFGMGADADVVGYGGAGTWGVGIQLADVSFIEDLSHTLRFAYYSGTSDKEVVRKFGGHVPAFGFTPLYLVDDDNVYEINFDHTYKIYENLTACLELAYIHLDRSSVWKHAVDDNINGSKTDDAWKAQIHFQYAF